MKQSFFATLLFLLLPLSIICRAESLTIHFVNVHTTTTQSFSVKYNFNPLLGSPTDFADTNGCAGLTLPHDDKPGRQGVYWLKMTFIESISWRLLFATNLLVAFQLILITNAPALSGKHYSWIPAAEVFVTFGWLLKSYWNPDSLLFKPMGQLGVSHNDSFEITSLMLPGQSQQQTDQQNPQLVSSGQQASGSGTTTRVAGYFTYLVSSDSDDGKEDPEQEQHTFGLNCYVASCYGLCKFRLSSNSSESDEGALNSLESSTSHSHRAMTETQRSQRRADKTIAKVESKAKKRKKEKRKKEKRKKEKRKKEKREKASRKRRFEEVDKHVDASSITAQAKRRRSTSLTASKVHKTVPGIIKHMNRLKKILTENDEHYRAKKPNPNIQVFENGIQLLEYLQPCDISKGEDVHDGNNFCSCCDGFSDTYYHVYYRGEVLLTVTQTVSETRFSEEYTWGESAYIQTNDLFDELYFASGAPGYQSAKTEFEEYAKSTGQVVKD
ncbi:hypothetical protein [Endozoicomonas sp. 8E]|uniref:hypothetical protein n=1 Tax=Endozoicomonas sp. 8E TaxID=3035692 RepID=UPI002938D06D|nr:hypothetical protein [Endozoicomonas sp. 8E]WOG27249.1 hypothetical protein P6910_22295 [Endozoicomonas sp. 8E]